MPERKRTPSHVEASVLTGIARRCCLCFYLDQDLAEKEGQLAHLDHDPSNGTEDNLVFLCLRHHSLYDSTTRQHKNYTIEEIRTARTRLQNALQNTPCEWVLVIDGPFSDFNKARVEAMAEHLRALLKDPHVTIKKILPGSVRLVVTSSLDTLSRLQSLISSGRVTDLLGYQIIGTVDEVSSTAAGALAQIDRELTSRDPTEPAMFSELTLDT